MLGLMYGDGVCLKGPPSRSPTTPVHQKQDRNTVWHRTVLVVAAAASSAAGVFPSAIWFCIAIALLADCINASSAVAADAAVATAVLLLLLQAVCMFCLRRSPSLVGSGLDRHFAEFCPCLAICSHCGTVLEVQAQQEQQLP